MPNLRCLADVAALPSLWLWPGRVPRGAITLLVGDPGRGKSLVTLDLAARVSTGRGWPDDAPHARGNDPGDILILSAEDSLSRTVRARLIALGADLRRIHYLNAGLWRDGTLADPHLDPDRIEAPTTFGHMTRRALYALKYDAHALKAALAALPECQLVVIDPITAYLNAADPVDLEEARLQVAPLATLADSSGAAIVVVAHRDASLGGQGVRLRQQLRALAMMARAIHVVDRLPDDSRRRVFAPVKNNLAEPQPALGFTVASAPEGGMSLDWSTAPLDLAADELLAGASAPGDATRRRVAEIDRAVAWLQGALAAGPVPSRDLAARAAAAAINDRCLARARARLGVTAIKHGHTWLCNLQPKSENKEHCHIADMAPLSSLSSLAPLPDIPADAQAASRIAFPSTDIREPPPPCTI